MPKRRIKRKVNPKPVTRSPVKTSIILAPIERIDYLVAGLLSLIAFLVFWQSLFSGFVYDMVIIMDEGFVTDPSNIWSVLSLKVLSMNTMTGARPATILYFMINSELWGRHPFGFHLGSNLFHAGNVALVYILLRRLVQTEFPNLSRNEELKVLVATAAVTLIFAVHPFVVETVAEISYSSDLMAAFFTLLVLLTAISFRPENHQKLIFKAAMSTLFAFAAVCCKESGITAILLLVVYWFLFRRKEALVPWLWYIGVTFSVSAVYMVYRLKVVPFNPAFPVSYMGGSLWAAIGMQPHLWTYMMGQMIWPTALSADYTLIDVFDHSSNYSILILLFVLAFQGLFAWKSRLGAFGIAMYWLGLSTVSNLMPLYRIEADRFYYLPLAGCALQILALLLMLRPWNRIFWVATACVVVLLGPLTLLNIDRQPIFKDEFSLWNETKDASPHSAQAHSNLCVALAMQGRQNAAIDEALKALALNPYLVDTHYNLGTLYLQQNRLDEAIRQYQMSFAINPNYLKAHENMGVALLREQKYDQAVAEFETVLRLRPTMPEAQKNLAYALSLQAKAQKH